MSPGIGTERRVGACMLLLLAAVPLLFALLPEHGMVAAVPIGAVLVCTALVLAPIPRRVWEILAPVLWLAASSTLVLYTGWFAPMRGVGWLLFVPLGLCLLTDRAWVGATGLIVATLVLFGSPGGPLLSNLSGFSLSPGVDLLGPLAAAVWMGWHAWQTVGSRSRGFACAQQRATAQALDEAICRDWRRLEAIARTVADPSLSGPVQGHGLGPNALSIAARIDGHRVLLGWIEGSPLATLTLGWGLLAACRAGLGTPRELLRLARQHFDEVIPPTAVRWLGIWDRRSSYVEAAPVASGAFHRCRLSSRGPGGMHDDQSIDTGRALRELCELPEDGAEEPGHPPPTSWWIGTTVVAALASVVAFMPVPVGLAASIASILLGAQAVQRHCRTRGEAVLEQGEAWLADRIEVHDDLRFQVSRLHGSLLPYQIEIGDTRATAHRLRGEVLDGTFADMVVDDRGVGHVVAGEVAGRGIAARFLGLAAQAITRVRLARVDRQSPHLKAEILRQLRVMGEALRYPVRMRLGEVTLHPDGRCIGSGIVRRLVEVRAPDSAGPAIPEEFVSVTASATIGETTRLYITPAPALPGPDDDAPALAASEATDRVVDVVASGKWHPKDGSLPSLFSLIFDGVHAPAHGTLIELASVLADEGEESLDDALPESPPIEIAVRA